MWQIRIQDPSGETRILPLQGSVTLGRSDNASIPLRDVTAPQEAACLSPELLPAGTSAANACYWLRIPDGSPACLLGDIPVRESMIPSGLPLTIGETRVQIEPTAVGESLPEQPSGVLPWLSCTEEGKKVLWTTKKIAATSLSIYLAGETGTGKEVLAHLIHAWSDRANGPFVPIHCGALPLSLVESELFGHVKGAFTGAIHQRPGALMQAHGGTLFLDEIGDLPTDIQVKLLRFLENGEIRAVGSDHTSRANVRLVCATHHNLEALINEGKFRRDLYYRIASITIDIPALRNRPDDIELLANRFAGQLGKIISPKAMLRLKAHSWPGNVRELRHAIERATGVGGPFNPIIQEESFEFLLTSSHTLKSPELELGASVLTLEEMERVLLLKALRISHGNRTDAAKILGVARSTLFEMLKRHKIQGPKSKGFC